MADKNETKETGDEQVAVVKKYANRRLYNTASSCYVTLDDLSKMVRNGEYFVVYDAKSGEDLTRSILTQIIMEEDSKGRNLLPINFLRQLIRFYDDSLQAFLPRYLDMSMENFSSHQEQIRHYIEGTFGRFFPIGQFEDMARQNITLLQQAASMFTPNTDGDNAAPKTRTTAGKVDPGTETSKEIRDLNDKIEALQEELNRLVEAQRRKPR